MIFAKTIDQVLSGRKSQTCRLAHRGDVVICGRHGLGVYTPDGRPRWIVGRTYAVQRGRCMAAEGRIRIVSVEPLPYFRKRLDEEFAKREGFGSAEECAEVWGELHGKKGDRPVWVLSLKVEARR